MEILLMLPSDQFSSKVSCKSKCGVDCWLTKERGFEAKNRTIDPICIVQVFPNFQFQFLGRRP